MATNRNVEDIIEEILSTIHNHLAPVEEDTVEMFKDFSYDGVKQYYITYYSYPKVLKLSFMDFQDKEFIVKEYDFSYNKFKYLLDYIEGNDLKNNENYKNINHTFVSINYIW